MVLSKLRRQVQLVIWSIKVDGLGPFLLKTVSAFLNELKVPVFGGPLSHLCHEGDEGEGAEGRAEGYRRRGRCWRVGRGHVRALRPKAKMAWGDEG